MALLSSTHQRSISIHCRPSIAHGNNNQVDPETGEASALDNGVHAAPNGSSRQGCPLCDIGGALARFVPSAPFPSGFRPVPVGARGAQQAGRRLWASTGNGRLQRMTGRCTPLKEPEGPTVRGELPAVPAVFFCWNHTSLLSVWRSKYLQCIRRADPVQILPSESSTWYSENTQNSPPAPLQRNHHPKKFPPSARATQSPFADHPSIPLLSLVLNRHPPQLSAVVLEAVFDQSVTGI